MVSEWPKNQKVRESLKDWFKIRMGNGIGIPWDFESRDTNPEILSPTGLKNLWRLDLGQKSLGQSRDKNIWDSEIPSIETTWDFSWDNIGISDYDYGFD